MHYVIRAKIVVYKVKQEAWFALALYLPAILAIDCKDNAFFVSYDEIEYKYK